jgi:hypothetical protein
MFLWNVFSGVFSQKPDTRFTRAPEFHHSGTVVPVDVKALEKEEAAASKALWRTPTGWIYPGRRTMQEANAHPKKPDSARVDELREVSPLAGGANKFLRALAKLHLPEVSISFSGRSPNWRVVSSEFLLAKSKNNWPKI